MADKNRDQQNQPYSSNQEYWDRNRNRYGRDEDYGQHENYGSSYGNVGYGRGERERNRQDWGRTSGSSYGSSQYSGANYDRDYDDGSRRNFGSQAYGASSSGNYDDRGLRSNYGSSTGAGYTGQRNYRRDDFGSSSGSGYGGSYGSSSEGSMYNRNRQDDTRRYGQGPLGSNYGTTSYGRGDFDRNERRGGRNEDRDWWDRTTDEVASWFGDDEADRRRRMDKVSGPHRGKGPKEYRRSDERIKEDINDRLADDSFIDASEVDVTVKEGEVTLSGTVDTKVTKRRAEDIVEAISGVKNVENHLRVSQAVASVGSSNVYRTDQDENRGSRDRNKSSWL